MLSRLVELGRGWHRFWFTAQSPLPLAVMRWLLGGMILYTHLAWSVDFTAFFVDQSSWQSRPLVDALQADQTTISFWWFVPTDAAWLVHAGCLLVLAAFWVGFATPVTAWLTFLIVISYANRAPLAMYGLDQVNTLAALYLAIGGSGRCLSLDAWIRRRVALAPVASGPVAPTASGSVAPRPGAASAEAVGGASRQQRWLRRLAAVPIWRQSPAAARQPTVASGVALRLFQVHLSFIYLWSGLGKLQGETWWTGEALWLAAASLDYQSNDLTWIASFPWLYQLLTVGTWVWELFFSVLIWQSRWRPLMLSLGVLMHLGIGMFMGMWTFGLAMIFLYVAFVPPPVLTLVGQRWRHFWNRLMMNEQHPQSRRRQRNLALTIGAATTAAALLIGSLLRPDEHHPQVLLQRGHQQLDRQAFDRAVQSFDAVLQQIPDHVIALHGRALAYDRLGETDSALADYDAAIELDPSFFEAINDRGILLLRSGDWDAGVADFRTLMGMEPANLTPRVNYAFAMQKAGQSAEAAACLVVIPPEQRDATVHYLLGCLAQQQADWAAATQWFTQSIEQDPGNLKAWLNRALCRAQLGDHQAAAADLDQVASLDEDWMLQGTLELLRGRWDSESGAPPAAAVATEHPLVAAQD